MCKNMQEVFIVILAKCPSMPMNDHTPNTGHTDFEFCPNLQDHLGG